MIQNPINLSITNKDRVQLVYQAVITLEAQTWAIRNSQNSLNAVLSILEAVEEAIHDKYSQSKEGDSNET